MNKILIVLLVLFAACNNAGITLEEVRKLDTLSNSDFNKVLRKQNDLALEGINLMKRAGEDTAAMRMLIAVKDEIDRWKELVKEKLPENFNPSPEQNKMVERVVDFEEQYARFR